MNPPPKPFAHMRVAFSRPMRSSGILVAFLWLLCHSTMAFDAKAPATMQVTVLDEQGKPVSKAVVQLRANGTEGAESASVRQLTNAKGQAILKTFPPPNQPSDSPDWGGALQVDCDGYLPHRETLALFPAAQLEKQIRLSRPQRTLIRLRGPSGKPLPYAPLHLSYESLGYYQQEPLRANERGEFSFVHGPLRNGLEVSVGGLHRSGLAGAEVTLTLNEEEMEALLPPHRVEGRVVTADGRPAVGWFIAHGVTAHSGGFLIGGPPQHKTDYRARKLTKLGADGSFVLDQNDEVLAVVSPRGVPFLYPLNGRSWPEATRHLTVRVPPVRRVHAGQLLHPDGQPAAQVQLSAQSMRPAANYWSFGLLDPSGESYWPFSPVRAPNGTITSGFATDARGRYEVPVYFGATINYRAMLPDNYWHADLTLGPPVTLSKHPTDAPTRQKRVTLVFTDEHGARIPDIAVTGYSTNNTPRTVSTISRSALVDTLGCHFFVPANSDRIYISANSPNWNQFTQPVKIAGVADQVVKIPVAEQLRRKPLGGTLLDPDGHPVVGATVVPYLKHDEHGVRGQSGSRGHERFFIGLSTKTDALGRFHFDAAPDECELEVYRFEEGANNMPLPGWTDPPVATRDQRELTIRLQRSGSVRVLLPEGIAKPPERLTLIGLEKEGEHIYQSVNLEPNSKTLFAPFVRPGQYQLINYDAKRLKAFTNSPVAVQPGEATVVDLTAANHLLLKPAPRVWTEFVVMQDDQPVSGAIVRFQATSSAAPWEQPQADLTDDLGRVRFLAKAGQSFTAVARVPGKLIGWVIFTAGRNPPLKIAMTQTKTLVVRLPADPPAPAAAFPSPPQVWIHLTDVAPFLAKAIFKALELEPQSYPETQASQGWGLLPVDTQSTRVAEDLPRGITCHVSVRDFQRTLSEGKVTLAADNQMVQEIGWK